ncbi:MAG: thermonuclease family protein [Spirochaetota bacterium]|nr:thermonuclease family protein [Spirochaetota bacterium]
MKRLSLVIIWLIIGQSVYTWNQVLPGYRQMVKKEGKLVRVLEVLDAKTISVRDLRKKVYHIGLLGINMDYSESQSQLEEKSIKLIKKLILGKNVYLLFDGKEKNLAENPRVFLYYPYDIKYLLNATLLEVGLARCSETESHWLKDDFVELEKAAQTKKIGIWEKESPQTNRNARGIEKPDKPAKSFSDPALVAEITAEIYGAKGDSGKLKGVYKRYGLDNQKLREEFFISALYFADDETYRSKLKERLKKIKKN